MTLRIVRPARRTPAPTARRLDIDAVVGFACVLMLPFALWLV